MNRIMKNIEIASCKEWKLFRKRPNQKISSKTQELLLNKVRFKIKCRMESNILRSFQILLSIQNNKSYIKESQLQKINYNK